MNTGRTSEIRAKLFGLTFGVLALGAVAAGCDSRQGPDTINALVPDADGGAPDDGAAAANGVVRCQDGHLVVTWPKASGSGEPSTLTVPDAGGCPTTGPAPADRTEQSR
jgi:hypothetical protein